MLIIENQYFGCLSYYLILCKYKYIKIEAFERYQKMSFRNRCVIYGANGLIHLSVPIVNGRDQRALIKDIKIDNSSAWQKKHFRSIKSAYGKTPYFEFYEEPLLRIFENKQTFLFDLNFELLLWLVNIFKIKGAISTTTSFKKDYLIDKIDYRNKWLPKNFQDEAEPLKYYQPFEERFGFQSNLSILDFLFNEGPAIK